MRIYILLEQVARTTWPPQPAAVVELAATMPCSEACSLMEHILHIDSVLRRSVASHSVHRTQVLQR